MSYSRSVLLTLSILVLEGCAPRHGAAGETSGVPIHPTAGIALHLEPQVGFLAPIPDADSLACETLEIHSPFTGATAAHVFVVGFDGVVAAQLGVRYPETLKIVRWTPTPLASAVELPGKSWPASGTWIAVAFGAPIGGESGLVHIGTFSLEPGSSGELEVIGVSADDALVKLVDADDVSWIVAPDRLAIGAVRTEGGEQAPCE